MRLVVVFFFKQKTAYEMRISDWSSDVCSSDLFTPFLQRRVEIGIDIVEQRPDPETGGERRAHADNLLGIGRRPALFGQDSDPATVHAEAVTRHDLADAALELGIL